MERSQCQIPHIHWNNIKFFVLLLLSSPYNVKLKEEIKNYYMSWCWWCCHPFEGEPLTMPCRYDDRRSKFYTAGNYCSWSCIKSHAIDKYGDVKGGIVCGNIILIISNTKKMDEIKNATTNNNALKLKRNKPLKRNHNNLESALGLIITPKS